MQSQLHLKPNYISHIIISFFKLLPAIVSFLTYIKVIWDWKDKGECEGIHVVGQTAKKDIVALTPHHDT